MELLELLLSCSYESTPHSHPLIHRHKYMMSCFGLITQNPFLSLIPPQDQHKRRRRRTDVALPLTSILPFQDDPSKTFIPRCKEAEPLAKTSAPVFFYLFRGSILDGCSFVRPRPDPVESQMNEATSDGWQWMPSAEEHSQYSQNHRRRCSSRTLCCFLLFSWTGAAPFPLSSSLLRMERNTYWHWQRIYIAVHFIPGRSRMGSDAPLVLFYRSLSAHCHATTSGTLVCCR